MIGISFGSWIQSRITSNNKSKQQSNKNKPKNEQKSIDNTNNESSNTNTNTNKNKHIGKKRDHFQIKHKGNTIQKYGEICLLRPTCELWTLALSHRTQILYSADKSLIIYLLQCKPNDIIFESGTGSGSLSTSFSRIISPFGHLFTFEFNALRVDYARSDFKNLLIDNLITVIHQNIVQNGFPNKNKLIDIINNILITYKKHNIKQEKDENKNQDINMENSNKKNKKRLSEYKDTLGGSQKFNEWAWLTEEKIKNMQEWIVKLNKFATKEFVDSVFLDLPKPWDVIKSAYYVLKNNAKICSFSPCIEQVQKTCQELSVNGFVDIRTFEVLSRDHLVKEHTFPVLDLDTNNSIHEIRSRPNVECKNENIEKNVDVMMTSRPVGKSFGHTGYLTFALKGLVQ